MKGWSAGRAMAHGISEDARALRTARGLCDCDLQLQNALYQGTGGVSANYRAAGFAPAYRNEATGETVISRFASGIPAPVHVLEGLPEQWVTQRGADGCVCRISTSVIAGFMRDGIFYTREEAARFVAEVASE